MDEHVDVNIKFMGNQKSRNESLSFVNDVLKEKGRSDDGIDLSQGLWEIASNFMVHIIDDDDSFAVKLESLTDTGETFEFVIDKDTRTIYRSVDDQGQQAKDDENMDFLDDI